MNKVYSKRYQWRRSMYNARNMAKRFQEDG